MDNIKDRQFYWEVKQFFNGKPENNVPSQPKPSLKDAVSGVLKENNPYKQTTFSNNQTSVNAAQNAIQGLGAMDAANKPSCVAYTKNAIKNPFNLNEGFWDTVSGILAPGGTQIAKAVNTAKNVKDAVETKANSDATEQRLNAEDARKKEIYQAANDRDKAFGGRWDAVGKVAETIAMVTNLADSGQITSAGNSNYKNNPMGGGLAGYTRDYKGKPGSGGLGGLANSMKHQNASLNPVASAQTTTPPVASSPTPVQTQTPKPASAPAPVQGQSQTAPAQTKAPAPTAAQGQAPAPAQGQAPAPAQGQAPAPTAAQGQAPAPSPEDPDTQPDYASDQDEPTREDVEDQKLQSTVDKEKSKSDKNKPPVSPPAPNTKNKPKFGTLGRSLGSERSAGQYKGKINMGMANGPARPEQMTLQSAMAQQNQEATKTALGQMGAVEGGRGSSPSSGFQGSVLPPMGQMSNIATQKENEFKYARGSRLS